LAGAEIPPTIGSRLRVGNVLIWADMNLDETQRKKVVAWIDEGLKLSDIQKPKDPAPPPKPAPSATPEPESALAPANAPASKVSVSVDQLARPGALVSGKVTFSDGKSAEWVLDQTGRLGVVPADKGYKPPPADLQEFQTALQAELQKLGL